jgi:hypothetical protein
MNTELPQSQSSVIPEFTTYLAPDRTFDDALSLFCLDVSYSILIQLPVLITKFKSDYLSYHFDSPAGVDLVSSSINLFANCRFLSVLLQRAIRVPDQIVDYVITPLVYLFPYETMPFLIVPYNFYYYTILAKAPGFEKSLKFVVQYNFDLFVNELVLPLMYFNPNDYPTAEGFTNPHTSSQQTQLQHLIPPPLMQEGLNPNGVEFVSLLVSASTQQGLTDVILNNKALFNCPTGSFPLGIPGRSKPTKPNHPASIWETPSQISSTHIPHSELYLDYIKTIKHDYIHYLEECESDWRAISMPNYPTEFHNGEIVSLFTFCSQCANNSNNMNTRQHKRPTPSDSALFNGVQNNSEKGINPSSTYPFSIPRDETAPHIDIFSVFGLSSPHSTTASLEGLQQFTDTMLICLRLLPFFHPNYCGISPSRYQQLLDFTLSYLRIISANNEGIPPADINPSKNETDSSRNNSQLQHQQISTHLLHFMLPKLFSTHHSHLREYGYQSLSAETISPQRYILSQSIAAITALDEYERHTTPTTRLNIVDFHEIFVQQSQYALPRYTASIETFLPQRFILLIHHYIIPFILSTPSIITTPSSLSSTYFSILQVLKQTFKQLAVCPHPCRHCHIRENQLLGGMDNLLYDLNGWDLHNGNQNRLGIVNSNNDITMDLDITNRARIQGDLFGNREREGNNEYDNFIATSTDNNNNNNTNNNNNIGLITHHPYTCNHEPHAYYWQWIEDNYLADLFTNASVWSFKYFPRLVQHVVNFEYHNFVAKNDRSVHAFTRSFLDSTLFGRVLSPQPLPHNQLIYKGKPISFNDLPALHREKITGMIIEIISLYELFRNNTVIFAFISNAVSNGYDFYYSNPKPLLKGNEIVIDNEDEYKQPIHSNTLQSTPDPTNPTIFQFVLEYFYTQTHQSPRLSHFILKTLLLLPFMCLPLPMLIKWMMILSRFNMMNFQHYFNSDGTILSKYGHFPGSLSVCFNQTRIYISLFQFLSTKVLFSIANYYNAKPNDAKPFELRWDFGNNTNVDMSINLETPHWDELEIFLRPYLTLNNRDRIQTAVFHTSISQHDHFPYQVLSNTSISPTDDTSQSLETLFHFKLSSIQHYITPQLYTWAIDTIFTSLLELSTVNIPSSSLSSPISTQSLSFSRNLIQKQSTTRSLCSIPAVDIPPTRKPQTNRDYYLLSITANHPSQKQKSLLFFTLSSLHGNYPTSTASYPSPYLLPPSTLTPFDAININHYHLSSTKQPCQIYLASNIPHYISLSTTKMSKIGRPFNHLLELYPKEILFGDRSNVRGNTESVINIENGHNNNNFDGGNNNDNDNNNNLNMDIPQMSLQTKRQISEYQQFVQLQIALDESSASVLELWINALIFSILHPLSPM